MAPRRGRAVWDGRSLRLGQTVLDLLVQQSTSELTMTESSGTGRCAIGAAGGQLFVEGASGAVARVLALTDLLRRLSAEE